MIKAKFDLNGDGKINFKDLKLELRKHMDTDKDGHVDFEECLKGLEHVVLMVKALKKD